MADQTVPNATAASFESPVTKTYPAGGKQGLTLSDMSSNTKMLVKGEGCLDVAFGASSKVGDAMVWGSRPGEWTVIGSPEAVGHVVQSLDSAGPTSAGQTSAGQTSAGHTSVIDHTHSRALFRLTGQAAASTMEKVCGLDFTDAMTPNGAVVSASVAKVGCDLARADDGGQSYLIACDRSFGQYLFDALLDSGDEFGIGVL